MLFQRIYLYSRLPVLSRTNPEIKLNGGRNPNWRDAKQFTKLQECSRIWILDYREQIQPAVRAGLVLGGVRGTELLESSVLTAR